jgi:hypothetical protein
MAEDEWVLFSGSGNKRMTLFIGERIRQPDKHLIQPQIYYISIQEPLMYEQR